MAPTPEELKEEKEEVAWVRKQERWKALSKPSLSTPTSHTYRRRLPFEEAAFIASPSNPLCPCCGSKLNIITSLYGEMLLGAFRKDTGEVKEIEDVLNPPDKVEVPITLTLPVLRKVRVCERCGPKLSKILDERPERKESSCVLEEARGSNQRLTSTRFDRARGFGRIFNNRKER